MQNAVVGLRGLWFSVFIVPCKSCIIHRGSTIDIRLDGELGRLHPAHLSIVNWMELNHGGGN